MRKVFKRAFTVLVILAFLLMQIPISKLNNMQVFAVNSDQYIDENGDAQLIPQDIVLLTGSETTLTSGWYTSNSDLKFSSRFTITGDVHIILKNSVTITVTGGICLEESNSLSIYAQSTDEASMGKLTATADFSEAAIGGNGGDTGNNGGNGGTITINGGAITVSAIAGAGIGGGRGGGGTYGGGGMEGGYPGTPGGNGGNGGIVVINDGIINVSSEYAPGIGGGDCEGGGGGWDPNQALEGDGGKVTINGGTVTTSSFYKPGIGGNRGAEIIINGGTVTSSSAYAPTIGGINYSIFDTMGTLQLPPAYIWWANADSNTQPSGDGTTYDGTDETKAFPDDQRSTFQFLKFQEYIPSTPSSECDIISFAIGDQIGIIDQDNGKITIELPKMNIENMLTPAITISDRATISPANGEQQDFADPVVYTVTAEDSTTTKQYEVTAVQEFEQWNDDVQGYRVGLKAPVGTFTPGSKFYATELIYDSPDPEIRKKFLEATGDIDLKYQEFYDKIGIYELYVENVHENRYEQLANDATVYIEVNGDFNPDKVIAVRIGSNEDVPLKNIRREIGDDGKIYFVADLDHFSYYALMEKIDKPVDNVPETDEPADSPKTDESLDVPKSGDNDANLCTQIMLISLFCAGTYISLRKNKRLETY